MSALSYLMYIGEIRGVKNRRAKALETLERVALISRANSRIRTLSKGMRQRVGLAQALIHDPEVLILDEPTAGVDPASRRLFWERIYELSSNGTTILVTTHYMDEAEYCDRISIMVAGKIAAYGTPAELKRDAGVSSVDELFVRLARAS